MTSFFRRMLMLACFVSLFGAAGCREEDPAPSTEPAPSTDATPSTDPDMGTQGSGNGNGDGS